MSKRVLVRNVIQGDVAIAEIGMMIPPDSVYPIDGVTTVEEALKIPSIKLHVDRGRLEVFMDDGLSVPTKGGMAKPKKKKKEGSKIYTKLELEDMGMKELRKIGKPYGAKDTKKSELVSEILAAQKGE